MDPLAQKAGAAQKKPQSGLLGAELADHLG